MSCEPSPSNNILVASLFFPSEMTVTHIPGKMSLELGSCAFQLVNLLAFDFNIDVAQTFGKRKMLKKRPCPLQKE